MKIVNAKGKDFQWFVENVWGSDERDVLMARLKFLWALRDEQEKGLNTTYTDYNLGHEKELIYSIGI